MKTKVLFFVLASAFLAMLVMGCEQAAGSDGNPGIQGPPGPAGTPVLEADFAEFSGAVKFAASGTTTADKIPAVSADTITISVAGKTASLTVTPGTAPTGESPVYFSAQAFANAVAVKVKAAFDADTSAAIKSLRTKVTLGDAVAYQKSTYADGSGTKVTPNSATQELDIVIPLKPKSGYYNPTSIQAFVITTSGFNVGAYWAAPKIVKKSTVDFETIATTADDTATFGKITVTNGLLIGMTDNATALSITAPKTSGVVSTTDLAEIILKQLNAKLNVLGLQATGGVVAVNKTTTGVAIGDITVTAMAGYKLTADDGIAGATIVLAPFIKPGSAATAFAKLVPVNITSLLTSGTAATDIIIDTVAAGGTPAITGGEIKIINGTISGAGGSTTTVYFTYANSGSELSYAEMVAAIDTMFATNDDLTVAAVTPTAVVNAGQAGTITLGITLADATNNALPDNATTISSVVVNYTLCAGDSLAAT